MGQGHVASGWILLPGPWKAVDYNSFSDSVVVPIPGDELPDPLLHRRLRPESRRLLQGRRVGLGGRDVAGLHGQKVELRLLAESLLDGPDVSHELDALVVADVVEAPGCAARRGIRIVSA